METYAIYGSTMRVEILVGGVPQQLYRRQSDGAVFVEAKFGQPYVIRVTSCVTGRLEVITSVDGRNTLKNEAAHPVDNTGMVIIGEWDCRGFRLSKTETKDFVFGDPEGSVAEIVTGSTANLGVIGLASYREFKFNPPPAIRPSIFQGGEDLLDYGLTRSSPKGLEGVDAGTHAGASHFDPVGSTSFMRATTKPAEMLTIQYRSHIWLVQNGIIAPDEPSPWPGYHPDDTGYGFLKNRK